VSVRQELSYQLRRAICIVIQVSKHQDRLSELDAGIEAGKPPIQIRLGVDRNSPGWRRQ
jgi:hypothetical protein